MQQLSTLDTTRPLDFDNLNLIIRPRAPRRRQSGASIIPFRPYVKRLTSVRLPHSYANGRDNWVESGRRESFFEQKNARCIGSLFDDCGTSEVIRWDIEGESTRLPMMCKFWMIVDGAVVERGKPRMVQDAAVQVYVAGHSLRSIIAAQNQQLNRTVITRYDRRRRHSWHDVNEYHSVPYFQYTSSIHCGSSIAIQCNERSEHFMSTEEYLPFIEEETADEHYLMKTEKHNAQEIIHHYELPQYRAQINITTETDDNPIETSSTRYSNRSRRQTSSSRHSDAGYISFETALNRQSYSTPDFDITVLQQPRSNNETNHIIQTEGLETESICTLECLAQRYERTLQDRRQAIAVINDQLLDIGGVLQRYRQRIREPVSVPVQSNNAIRVSRDIVMPSPKPRQERSSSPVSSTGSTRSKYRFLPSTSREEIHQDYLPSPLIYITTPILNSPRQPIIQTEYCDICLTDHGEGSAWIRYNEQRLETLQQRIDLMLEFNDMEDVQSSSISSSDSVRNIARASSTQRIDNILMGRSQRRNQLTYNNDQISVPHRTNYRSSRDTNSMVSEFSHYSPRNLSRSILPASKRVRISTTDILIPNQAHLHEPMSSSSQSIPRPIVSILRRNNINLTARLHGSNEISQLGRRDMNKNRSMIDQFTIPRYYRLYNDVGFREVYDFSCVLNSYLNRTTSQDYSSMIQHFALDHQIPAPIISAA
ncbi:unnamed protein product [Adineta steineri]|uniref:Uncharacterized protein n=1 Tax=Adineta steineri TaxID=433720 RepID=A0A813QIN9_9BILA|nr:unnamed protein product [Adineta steineri]